MGYGIQDTARAFGFGAPTGISLGGDQSGRIPDLAFNQELNKNGDDPTSRTWRHGDSASLAVGQGDVLVTPLQLADGYADVRERRNVPQPAVRGRHPRQQCRTTGG